MIVWSVIRKLEKEIKEQYPELTEKEQEDLVWMSYREIERRVLMGTNSPIGVVDLSSPSNSMITPGLSYSYPGILSKHEDT